MNKSKTQPRLLGECELLAEKDQGSDKGGGVVQMVLVDTKRNA